MSQNRKSANNNNNYFDNYDFLNFSYKQIQNFKECKKFGGKNGISFENNSEKYDKLIT